MKKASRSTFHDIRETPVARSHTARLGPRYKTRVFSASVSCTTGATTCETPRAPSSTAANPRNTDSGRDKVDKAQIVKEDVPPPADSAKTGEAVRTKSKMKGFHRDQKGSAVSGKDKHHVPANAARCRWSNSFYQPAVSESVDPDKALFIKNTRKVNVTCVINPAQFYVRNEGFELIIDKLCRDDAEEAPIPEEVKIGCLYLAQSQSDRRWYRCRVLGRTTRGKKYQVQFVDYGHTDRVLHSRLRVLDEEYQRVDDGAYKCALYDVVSADGHKDWAPEIRQIMYDFVKNKQILMYVVGSDTEVDLIVPTVDGPKSLRESLFYLNMAKPDPNPPIRGEDSSRRMRHLEKVKQQWICEYRRLIPARTLQKDDVFRTKIISSVSPNEFYICKSGWLDGYQAMKADLGDYCGKAEARIAFLPHVGMVCAFADKDRDGLLVWKRGRVLKVTKGSCRVDSVDTGHRLTVPWQNIREIPPQFCSPPEFAVRCCLMHIQPFMENFYQWTEEAVDFFNRIARTSFVFRVIVGEQETNAYGVALYLVKRRLDVCVNGLMVKNKFAVSIGMESTIVEQIKETKVQKVEEDTQGSNSTRSTVEKRVPRRAQVEILRVVSPSEFYVSLITNDYGIARMQEFIQDKMRAKKDEGSDKISWQQGEICLVFPVAVTVDESDTLDREWYRARVLETIAEGSYRVFLIDKALTIPSHYSEMRSVDLTILQEFRPFAIRCSLACIGPTGRLITWNPSAVDAFKVAIKKFKLFAISLHGRCEDGAIPVILWGMTVDRTNALSSQLYAYTNVNKKLVQYGYAHLKEKFPPVTAALSIEEELERHYRALDNYLDNLDADTEDPIDEPKDCNKATNDYRNDVTDESTPIDRWLPAKPIDKEVFIGIPTFVDNCGTIYLHDAELHSTVTAIKEVIHSKWNGTQQLPGDKFYSAGEPCLAKYHLDEQFYRAVVRKAMPSARYEVQLVDYGIIEICNVKDLRKNVICGRIPILANKYRLTSVVPKKSESTWPFVTIDALHALIVDKQCEVRVDTDMDADSAGVIPCYIKTMGEFTVEVPEYLLNMFDQLYDPFANISASLNDSVPASKKTEKDNKTVPCETDMESYFNEKELTELLGAINATAERKEDDEDEDSSDCSELDLNQHYFYSYDDVRLKKDAPSPNVSFNSNEFDTSTQLDRPLETARITFNGFVNFSLDKSVEGFYCEVTNMLGPFNMFVYPQLDDHIRQMKDMMGHIQFYATKHSAAPAIKVQMPCLSKFKQDGFWYRALVLEHFPDRGEARVLYVDYLNEEIVRERDILKCPSSLRKVPIRNLQVKLHGLQINPRLRKADVAMKLVELIEGKRLYARIVAQNSVLEVELFSTSKCDRLVYHQMIKEKYFVRKK